jgi:hypothetical protein
MSLLWESLLSKIKLPNGKKADGKKPITGPGKFNIQNKFLM